MGKEFLKDFKKYNRFIEFELIEAAYLWEEIPIPDKYPTPLKTALPFLVKKRLEDLIKAANAGELEASKPVQKKEGRRVISKGVSGSWRGR